MKEAVLNLIKSNKDSFVQIIKAKYKEFYNEICEKYNGRSFSEKIYKWLNEMDGGGICLKCGTPTKFLSIAEGYRKYCSAKCSNVDTAGARAIKLTKSEKDLTIWEQKNCIVCGNEFWAYKKRNSMFCSNKCSASFTANDPNRLKKIRETKFKKYGDSAYVNLEKQKVTMLEKYGVDNIFKLDGVKEKIKSSNLSKYGVEWTWQAEEVKEKIRKTNLNRYGEENPSKSSHIKEKVINTSLDKYGVSNPSKSKEIIDKIKGTNLLRYGNVCPIKNKEVLLKVEKSRKIVYYNKIKSRLSNRVEFLFDAEVYISTDKKNKYSFKCLSCGSQFEDHMDGGRMPRCLSCYPYISGFSKGEKEIIDYLNFIFPVGIEIEERNRSILNGLELDIYLPTLKMAIEFNGLYWHSEIGGNKDKFYHYNKYKKCKDLGIRLIQIFEDEWVNKSDIVKNRLKYIFGLSVGGIYARNCEVREIEFDKCRDFLDKYHIQGSVPARVNLGLFFKEELVSVMSFSLPRLCLGVSDKKTDTYELLRMATSQTVIGGPSKMFSYFIKNYFPKCIFSFSDRRWNTGAVYEKIGMVKRGESYPNYWYFKHGECNRYHRFNFRKNVLFSKLKSFDVELSEWENMQLNGYDRIWDCGSNKYVWEK